MIILAKKVQISQNLNNKKKKKQSAKVSEKLAYANSVVQSHEGAVWSGSTLFAIPSLFIKAK